MSKLWTIAAFVAAGLAATPASALNNDDYAAMMGMMWRFQRPECPRLSFDPEKFVIGMKLPGGSAAAFRDRHREAFDRGDAIISDLRNGKDLDAFCKAAEEFFDGKHDFYGNVKEVPDRAPPGLTIRP